MEAAELDEPLRDWLADMLGDIMEGPDCAGCESLVDLVDRVEEQLAVQQAQEEERDASDGIAATSASSSSGAASSSGIAAGFGEVAAEEIDIGVECTRRGLVDMSLGKVWRFSFADAPDREHILIHSIARAYDGMSIKATCKLHPRCGCWMTRVVRGAEVLRLLQDYMDWFVAGRGASEQDHWRMSQQLKRSYGMHIK